MASYLSDFVRVYEECTGERLPKYGPKAHEKFNGVVKYQFSAVIKNWKPFTLFALLHNPLDFHNVTKYNSPDVLALCVPAFLTFLKGLGEENGQYEIERAVRRTAPARKVIQREDLRERLSNLKRVADRERRGSA